MLFGILEERWWLSWRNAIIHASSKYTRGIKHSFSDKRIHTFLHSFPLSLPSTTESWHLLSCIIHECHHACLNFICYSGRCLQLIWWLDGRLIHPFPTNCWFHLFFDIPTNSIFRLSFCACNNTTRTSQGVEQNKSLVIRTLRDACTMNIL